MSYYGIIKYKLTDHAISRLKQREPKFKDMSNIMISAHINQRLNNIRPAYTDTNGYLVYIDPYNQGYSFLINQDNIVITYTKRSINKGDFYAKRRW
ncbi:hypothetical protein [Ureaplasma diversum]|uniref:DUF4258 domain-containing protein n=1 Tax=Ureaplasma diversum NCTC 246 TaxID=1188241 RepID=A0A084F111_9BACT|nr:hypothetical protein [Ureaplasma diversum]KEZ23903.1 hypothetical protein UDIV_2000 [Ureaplasma diversum NCTC 246]